MLHPFRVPFRGWPVTQGAAPGFALHSALGYFLLPFQGSGNVQPPGPGHRPGVNVSVFMKSTNKFQKSVLLLAPMIVQYCGLGLGKLAPDRLENYSGSFSLVLSNKPIHNISTGLVTDTT